jgi:glutamine cyclotransferase
MKNIISILGFAGLFMASCQGGTAKKTQAKIDSTIVTNTAAPDVAQCYQYIKNRDTATLSLKTEDNKITGSLGYNLYEKDKNAGTIAGIVKGDTIIANYTFLSEGKTSVREVVFLKQGDQLAEGFGDVQEVKGEVKYKDVSKLKFDGSMVFNKIDCK